MRKKRLVKWKGFNRRCLPAIDHHILWSIKPSTSHNHLKVLLCRGFSTVLYHEYKIASLALLNSKLWSFLLKKKEVHNYSNNFRIET